jgi:hypothetical protein
MTRSGIEFIILALSFIFACEGKQGPVGPAGPQGEPGPGTRIVYTSSQPIPSDAYSVNIPEITLNDMPLVSVYIRLEGTTMWYEIPAYFENLPEWGQMCFFFEGEVVFLQCADWYYRIIIVI